MPRRYTGGFLSGTEQLTDANKANGIFTVQEAGALTATGQFPIGGFNPTRSARFRYGLNANLSKSVVFPGDTKTWTWSSWVKRGAINGTQQFMFNATASQSYIQFSTAEKITVGFYSTNSSTGYVLTTSATYRDPSAWYHIVVQVDTTKAISTERIKLYVNGVQVTSFSSASYPAQNDTGQINSVMVHRIGSYDGTQLSFSGYMTEVNFIDGQALNATSFGMSNAATGTWVPKPYSGTYGTNGFYLPYNTDTTSYTANVLVVGGGGGGAGFIGGGGGGGGYVSRDLPIVSGNIYTVTVGGGGAVNTSGSNSLLGSYIAAGGGAAGGYEGDGLAGGSGGGAGGTSGGPARAFSGGATLYSQGSVGGTTPQQAIYSASGGGGAGGAGGNSSSTTTGANGGSGSTWSVNSTTYAGGAGGGTRSYNSGNGGDGGSGGGGNGGGVNHAPSAGTTNRGGGGGGHGFIDGQSAAAGGSGVVLIRVPDTQSLTFSAGVTYSGGSASGGYKLYTVTATSTTSETVTFS